MSLGLIVAGLTPDDLASLDTVALSGVTATAVAHFTSDHLTVLSHEKLSAIPREALSGLKVSQLPSAGSTVLNSTQVIGALKPNALIIQIKFQAKF